MSKRRKKWHILPDSKKVHKLQKRLDKEGFIWSSGEGFSRLTFLIFWRESTAQLKIRKKKKKYFKHWKIILLIILIILLILISLFRYEFRI